MGQGRGGYPDVGAQYGIGSVRFVTHGKLYLVAGSVIAIALTASTSMLALHMDGEREAKAGLEKQLDAMKKQVDEGFAEVRSDIKALIRK